MHTHTPYEQCFGRYIQPVPIEFLRFSDCRRSCPWTSVIHFLGAFYREGAVTIVTEYMDGGSLLNVLQQVNECHARLLAKTGTGTFAALLTFLFPLKGQAPRIPLGAESVLCEFGGRGHIINPLSNAQGRRALLTDDECSEPICRRPRMFYVLKTRGPSYRFLLGRSASQTATNPPPKSCSPFRLLSVLVWQSPIPVAPSKSQKTTTRSAPFLSGRCRA